MMCKNPFRRGVAEFGCGQCLTCRINYRRQWQGRLVLEATQHQHSCFITLTYNEKSLPEGGTLVPEHLTLFLKRLRFALEPVRIRYFAVGEYGDDSWRPHYHALIFGAALSAEFIAKLWSYGGDGAKYLGVHVGDVTPDSCAYCASYALKRLTNDKDERLNGRYPEFTRMSRHPGIGAYAADHMAKRLEQNGQAYLALHKNVPGVIRLDGKKLPIGKYLRRRMKEALKLPVGLNYRRDQQVLDVSMLQRAFELRALGTEVREAKRSYSIRRAENFERLKRIRKGRGL